MSTGDEPCLAIPRLTNEPTLCCAARIKDAPEFCWQSRCWRCSRFGFNNTAIVEESSRSVIPSCSRHFNSRWISTKQVGRNSVYCRTSASSEPKTLSHRASRTVRSSTSTICNASGALVQKLWKACDRTCCPFRLPRRWPVPNTLSLPRNGIG